MISNLKFDEKEDFLTINESTKIIFDSLDVGVLVLDIMGKIIFANNKYKALFKLENKYLKDKLLFSIHSDNILKKALSTKEQLEGYLNYKIGDQQLYATASPIVVDHKFSGVTCVYQKKELNKIVRFNNRRVRDFKLNNNCFDSIIGENEMLLNELYKAERAAKTNVTILLQGESGTGKELLAKEIHKASQRNHRQMITLNCGAIPNNLIESELFGHKKGSFTGAVEDKVGKFELANGSTLFLDEIGDLPFEMQVKLLRVLQNSVFTKVGGNDLIETNVRIIAATNKNLKTMVDDGDFREDLYYRLNVVPIELPPLRHRTDDIEKIVNLLNDQITEELNTQKKQISQDVIRTFEHYHWPGNIRELKNILKRIIIFSDEQTVGIQALPEEMINTYHYEVKDQTIESLINFKEDGEIASLIEYEKEIVKAALKRHKSFNAASKVLGVTHKTVASKARKFNIL